MIKDYFFIAFSSLRKRFLRTSLTMLGIFIGIASVVALISLGQGMSDAINGQFASLGSDTFIVQGVQAGFGPPGQLSAGEISVDDVDLVGSVSGVGRVAGRLLRSVSLEFAGDRELIFGGSIPDEGRDLVYESLNLNAAFGRLLKNGDRGKVMVGSHYWERDHFSKPLVVGSKVVIAGENFEVVGLLERGAAFANNAVFFNYDDLKRIVDSGDSLSAVVGEVLPGEDVNVVGDRVLRSIRRDRHQKEGFEDVSVSSSQDLIASINTILGVVQAVFIGIAAISLFVGGIGIMNTMYTSVLERTREIGVMKAIGARNSDVLLIFLFESGLLGLVGGVIGVVLGFGLSTLVEVVGSNFASIQASYSLWLIVGALSFSFVVGVISGVFPARQAARLPPVDALRGD